MSLTYGGDLPDGSLRSLYSSDIANGVLRDLPGDTLAAILDGAWGTSGVVGGLTASQSARPSLSVVIAPGIAVSKGAGSFAHLKEERTVVLPAAHPTQNRVDLIGFQFSPAARQTRVDVVAGATSASLNPLRPDAPNSNFLPLHYVFRPAGSAAVTQADISPASEDAVLKQPEVEVEGNPLLIVSALPDEAPNNSARMLISPAQPFDLRVNSIIGMQADDTHLYVLGDFDILGGTQIKCARFDLVTGQEDPTFDLNETNFDIDGRLGARAAGRLSALGVSNDRIYIGQEITGANSWDIATFDKTGARVMAEDINFAANIVGSGYSFVRALFADSEAGRMYILVQLTDSPNSVVGSYALTETLEVAASAVTQETRSTTIDGLIVYDGYAYAIQHSTPPKDVRRAPIGDTSVNWSTWYTDLIPQHTPDGGTTQQSSLALLPQETVLWGLIDGQSGQFPIRGLDGSIFVRRNDEWVRLYGPEAQI